MSLRTLRAAAAAAALVPAALVGMPAQWLALKLGSPLARAIPGAFHRYVLAAIGVRLNVAGRLAAERPLLLASNHVSWMDIAVLSAAAPVSFVAKAEIARWPLFGTFARLQRSIFVDRTRKSATGTVNRSMAARLTAGDALVLFAEGTSGDGNRVLPFRSALLGAAGAAIADGGAAAVQPVSIAYTHRNGLPLGLRTRPDVAWYGDRNFASHFWAVLKDGAIDVTVTFGTPIRVEAGSDRKVLARAAEDEVRRLTAAALRGRPIEAPTAGTPLEPGARPLAAPGPLPASLTP